MDFQNNPFYHQSVSSNSDFDDYLSTEEILMMPRPIYRPNYHFPSPLDFNFHHKPHKRQNYRVIEEEFIDMTNQQQQRNKYEMMENFTTNNNNIYGAGVTEEHIDFTGASNGEAHPNDVYNAQRRPSFKKHYTVSYGLSQQGLFIYLLKA
jgi:hypothetical protein